MQQCLKKSSSVIKINQNVSTDVCIKFLCLIWAGIVPLIRKYFLQAVDQQLSSAS